MTDINEIIWYCKSLKSIDIPESVTSIYNSFQSCPALENVTLHEGLTKISDSFNFNGSIKELTIPSTVREINGSFGYKDSLKTVILKGKTLPKTDNSFSDVEFSNATLWVDEDLLETCRTTAPWSFFGTIAKMPADWKSFTVTAAGMATCCSDKDLDLSDINDVKAYVASGFNPSTGKVLLSRAWKIPAGTGFILRGDASTYKLPSNTTDYVYANLLVGTQTDTEVPETDGSYTNYVLGNGNNGVGFYRSQGGTMKAGKAYLHVPTATAASLKCIRFSFDDEEGGSTTGFIPVKILTSGSAAADAPVYNLSGQRKLGLSKGMNIRGGQKIWVK